MKIKLGYCVCEINDNDILYWENLNSSQDSIISDRVGIVMNDGSRYVYVKERGLMYIPKEINGKYFYESFRED